MPSAVLKKAVKDGLISQKQYDKMPEKMLEGLVKSKKKKKVAVAPKKKAVGSVVVKKKGKKVNKKK